MSRPTVDTLGPRFVCSQLVNAEEALVDAQKATEDRAVADAIAKARKELAPAVKRARLILDDVRLRHAPQINLLDPTQGVDE